MKVDMAQAGDIDNAILLVKEHLVESGDGYSGAVLALVGGTASAN